MIRDRGSWACQLELGIIKKITKKNFYKKISKKMSKYDQSWVLVRWLWDKKYLYLKNLEG
jgi:Uma2 family endonuclease